MQSVFLDMFGDPVSNPKGWEIKSIKDFGKIITGNTPPREDLTNYGDNIEWIKSDNINTPYHFLTKADEYLSEKGRKIGRVVPSGSILVSCIAGSYDCIGNVALTDREISFNQQINAIIPNKEIEPYFLYSLILLSKKLIQRASTNSMKGMVNKTNFGNIKLIHPPLNLQKSFAQFFEKKIILFRKANNSQKVMDNLFQSLLQKAFKGELNFNEEYSGFKDF